MLGHWPSIDLYRTQSTSIREAILNPHYPAHQQPRGQTGFSFIETLIVLAVLSVVVVQQLRTSELTSVDRVSAGMVEKFQRVQRASMRFYIREDSWPENVQALETKGFLNAQELSNTWGKAFELTIDDQDLLISSDLTEVRYASRVVGRLPRSSLAEAVGSGGAKTKVTSRIDPPGHEAAHNKLYRLDGSKPLEGPMNLNGHNVSNGGDITAQKFIDVDDNAFYVNPNESSKLNSVELQSLALMPNVVVGHACDKIKHIGTTPTGALVSCVGESTSESTSATGIWRIPHELPVGAIYISLTEDNPSGLLGYGEWVSFGEEQVLVGQKKSDIPNADKRCIPGENNEADCWQYTLGQTNQKNSTTNITEATQLSLSQTPVHRHFADFTKLENDRCNPDCTVLSGHSSDYNSSATEHRALGTTRSARTHMSEAKKELLAIIANLEIEIAYYLNTLNSLKIKPYRSVRLGDAEFGNGHDHKINQPSIVVKMWKRTG
jgi:prepilin-type N-terminal cleavage/methylation domain-containing protein